MIRPIVMHPDPRLAKICAPVTGDVGALVEDMFETMYSAPGRGLAAPQVGVMDRLFVMDTTWKEGDMSPAVFINPRIIARSEAQQVNVEGCLSIPDTPRQLARAAWVDVAWQDLSGGSRQGRFDGFAAACVQHEMDHLDGVLILDHPEVTREAP